MKKLLLVLAIGAFVACNNNAEGTEVKADSPAVAPAPAPDTVVVKPDTTVVKPDTSAVKK